MSITKSYNKHTDTYYAYDTTYIWSEDKQKKVQKKVCIGQYDKEGNIIPNARRGRPSRNVPSNIKEADPTEQAHHLSDMGEISQTVTDILSEIHQIEKSLGSLASKSRELESKVVALQSQLAQKG